MVELISCDDARKRFDGLLVFDGWLHQEEGMQAPDSEDYTWSSLLEECEDWDAVDRNVAWVFHNDRTYVLILADPRQLYLCPDLDTAIAVARLKS